MTRSFAVRRAFIALLLASGCSNDPADENSNNQQADLGPDIGEDVGAPPDLPDPLPPKFPGPCSISSVDTDGNVAVTNIRYDERGNPIEVGSDRDGDGLEERVTRYTYDVDSRLILDERDNPVGPPIERSVGYTYDEMGRLLRIVRTNFLTDPPDIDREDYTWDNLTATVRVDFDGDGTINGTRTETYDTDGHLVRSVWDLGSDQVLEQVDTWTFQDGLLVEFTALAMGMLSMRLTYEYDENGNLVREQSDADGDGTFDSIATYENDERGNPLRGVSGNVTWTYDYSCWE